jgi:hypothetical protein
VLKPKARAAVVYSWGNESALMKLASPYRRVNGRIAAFLGRNQPKPEARPEQLPDSPAGPASQLYFHTHPYIWFKQVLGSIGPFKLKCWRSVNVAFQRAYIHDRMGGRQMLLVLACSKKCSRGYWAALANTLCLFSGSHRRHNELPPATDS